MDNITSNLTTDPLPRTNNKKKKKRKCTVLKKIECEI